MAKHSWTNRTLPPLVVVAVVGCVWYALQSRPSSPSVVVAPKANATPTSIKVTANATAIPAVSPIVKKLGAQLEFSVNPAPYKHVQRIEFYVEAQFVGAAYSQPYSVAVSEDNLTAGNHTVTAKIYMDNNSTKSSQPASFTAAPKTPPAPAIDSDADTGVTTPPASPTDGAGNSTPSNPAALAAPTDVSGTASSDGTSATLSWTGPEGAVQYQVWRDSVQVATTTGVGYTDTGLNPGQTYDYSVVALDASSNTSIATAMLAVTMPTPLADNPEDTQSQPNKTDTQTPQDTDSTDTTPTT